MSFTGVQWLEVDLGFSADQAPFAEVLLERYSRRGWVELGSAYRFYLPQEPGWEEVFRSFKAAAAAQGFTVEIGGQVKDEDWAENWKKFYHPLKVGKRLVVCPSWEKYEAAPGESVMVLDPGSAFGTGYHGSTQLCLRNVERYARAGLRMLDLGTGSGILAIGAWLLGAREVRAVDNDPVAVKVAQENFDLNEVGVRAELGDAPAGGPYDLITANLVAALLVELSASLVEALAPGGVLIAGGIIQERRDEVIEAYSALECLDVSTQDDWVSLVLRKT